MQSIAVNVEIESNDKASPKQLLAVPPIPLRVKKSNHTTTFAKKSLESLIDVLQCYLRIDMKNSTEIHNQPVQSQQ